MKIKQVTYYICQFCNEKFTSEKECRQHEAEEMGLSVEDYAHLEMLEKKEKYASHNVLYSNNDNTRAKRDKTTEAVIAFRKKHNLSLIHI